MVSPVSPVVSNLCLKEIEEQAIITTTVPPKIWKRYVNSFFFYYQERCSNSLQQHPQFY